MTTDVVGSNIPADDGYGQNGYDGASSDLPGKRTSSGFLPQVKVPGDNWQTRDVSKQAYATHTGMSSPKAPTQIVGHIDHRK